MDDLDDHLARVIDFVTADAGGLVLHPLDEIARNRQRDVGFEQRHAHFAQRGHHVGFGQRTRLRQAVEYATKAF
jgi:hypothetical protein